MRKHKGEHPRLVLNIRLNIFCKALNAMLEIKMFSFRMGALDVCPFIPISGVTEEECVQVSKNFGARLGKEVQNI